MIVSVGVCSTRSGWWQGIRCDASLTSPTGVDGGERRLRGPYAGWLRRHGDSPASRDLHRNRAERVQRVVMGIDGELFRRDVQPPGTGRLLAVGRLVEKKGFADLLDALARLPHPDLVEGLRIVGDGPLRGELEAQIGRLGLEDRVELAGWRDRDQIRAELERADLLVMPCVVARDGDRDSMPVVVKEAMAMEVPVIGTDEVGLPELIRSQWGRLVPPHDPDALARAIDELLALPAQERARMGAAGLAHVLEHCDVHRETRRLLELLDRYA